MAQVCWLATQLTHVIAHVSVNGQPLVPQMLSVNGQRLSSH